MFIATIINFLLSSYNVGSEVARFIMFIRMALTQDIDSPLSEKRELVDNALRNLDVIYLWAPDLPVSIKLSLSDPVPIQYSCSVEMLLSAFIVIWRAWALFRDQQWVTLLPFSLWIGTVGEWSFSGKLLPFAEPIHSQGRPPPE